PCRYYWSVQDSEWASDVMFRSRPALAEVYPQLLRYAITTFAASDVLRFLGQPVGASGKVPHHCRHEVITNLKERLEGTRINHGPNANPIKRHDKGSVLRAECMIRQPEDFKVYRAAEGAADGPKAWRPLRHGIADLHRRAEVSQSANERYLDALAAVHDTTPIRELTEPLCRPLAHPGRRRGSTTPAAAQSGAADLEQQGVAAPAGDNALAFGPTQAMEPATATPAAPPPSSSGGRLAAEEGEPVMASPGPRAKEPSAAATASMTAGLVAALAVCAPAGAEPQVTEACPGTQPG